MLLKLRGKVKGLCSFVQNQCYMSNTKPSLPKGIRDFGHQVSAKRNFIIEVIRKHFRNYGFCQLETPSMENLSVLTGKYGEEGDQLLFRVLNSGDFLSKTTGEDYKEGSKQLASKIAEKGLRYDLTVPFARYVAMNKNDILFPFKRFQIQPVWRADRPQKGRYREFYQCDADVIGSRSIWNEAELTLLLDDVFLDLGLEDYIIKVNHREILFALAKYVGLEGHEVSFCAELDKLDKIGSEKVAENVRTIGADRDKLGKVMLLLSQSSTGDPLSDCQSLIAENRGISDVRDFLETLDQFRERGFKLELDLRLARGLSYYTGIIFEVKSTSVQMGSICGGGRYDDLTGIFGLNDVSGVGISFGLDRIYDVMEALNLFPQKISQNIDALIVHFGKENQRHGQKLVMKLRDEGIKAEVYPEQVKIQKQLNYADRIGSPYTIVIGDEERADKKYSLKDMTSGNQQKLELDQLVNVLQS